jgi:hypothetical protein
MANKSVNTAPVVNFELELLKQETRRFAENIRDAREILEEINSVMQTLKQLREVQS